MSENERPELTILMPCLNEAETLEVCINKARQFLCESGVSGEVLIADNGSTDGSQDIAKRCGARVESIPARGYGSALIGGTLAAKGKYVIMGDADDSYDFTNLMPFVEKLREGYQLVMGNRFKGGIAPGAMPPLHRYLGNPVLSFFGRLFYSSSIGDFHCGLRGYERDAFVALDLQTTGMEYASEMVVQAQLHGYKIAEVPTTLKKDGRSRPPHLRSWSDGWRHLRFLLMYSPNWLFLYPGILLTALGTVFMALLSLEPLKIGSVRFDVNTMVYAAAAVITGVSAILFSVFTRTYAETSHYIPSKEKKTMAFEKVLLVGLALFIAGLVISVVALGRWSGVAYGDLDPRATIRLTIPALTLITCGLQLCFGSFLIGILRIKHK